MAVTSDGTVAVVANRTSGEIRVESLTLTSSSVSGLEVETFSTFALGEGSEPFSVVLSNDEESAYVILRATGQIVKIEGIKGNNPSLAFTADTNAEPSGLAISTDGLDVLVTNWGSGTVSRYDAADLSLIEEIDLNQALVDAGVLGPISEGRTGLARPYGIVTVPGVDSDRVYVTEFFAQDLPTATFTDDSYFDTNKQGIVYAFDLDAADVVDTITLAPTADAGFTDSNGAVAGCFPNQLFAIAENPVTGNVHISGICASPRGPVASASNLLANVQTKVFNYVWQIDTVSDTQKVDGTVNLNRRFLDRYTNDGTAASAIRYPLIPNSLSFARGTNFLYLTGYGSDAVFRVTYKTDGTFDSVGASVDFMDLSESIIGASGQTPYGVYAIKVGADNFAFTVNEATRNVTALHLNSQSKIGSVATATPVTDPLEIEINNGRKFFVTGRGRWSAAGQAWNSCEGCHPHGLTDNVTWFFAAGPRQSTSLDASYDDEGNHRIFNWTAVFDEVADFEGNTRGVSGGVGAVVHNVGNPISNADRIILDTATPITGQQKTKTRQDGLFGSVDDVLAGVALCTDDLGVDVTTNGGFCDSKKTDWTEIDEYVRTIRAPKAPAYVGPGDAEDGAALFEANGCQGCHGTNHWTIADRFWTPSQVNNAADNSTGIGLTTYNNGNIDGLNPPSNGTGTATIRGTGTINCVLRDVGTFPATGTIGIAPSGVVVSERREDMTTTAAGINGFNPPSLLGAGTSAPYFHAGNARTLEEALGDTFSAHRGAYNDLFDGSQQNIDDMTAFILSIDDNTDEFSTVVGSKNTVICPANFP